MGRKPKFKRKFISLQQKIDILDQLNNNKKLTAIAKDMGINESSIRTIKQNENKIRSAAMSRSLQTLSKSSRIKDSLIPKTEKCLIIWIEDCKRNNISINSALIKAKAQKIFTYLKKINKEPNSKFLSSNGWLERFRKRFSLHINGQCSSDDNDSADMFKRDLRKVINEGDYTARQVYNACQTGLYWKKMHHKGSTERLTLLVCSNALGDHITKPMLINSSLSPQTTFPIHWRTNKYARLTSDIFRDWFYNCFVLEVQNYSKSLNIPFKALLVIDNAAEYALDLEHPNVKLLYVPLNITWIVQPLKQGITKMIKAYYIHKTINLNTDVFTTAKCIELLLLSIQELKPSILNACWKNVWPECVLQENATLDPTIINIEPTLNIKGRDIYNFINDGTDLDEVELVELADCVDESAMQPIVHNVVEDEVDNDLCIENLNKILSIGKQLEEIVTNCDPSVERIAEFKINLQYCLEPYVKMQKEYKSNT